MRCSLVTDSRPMTDVLTRLMIDDLVPCKFIQYAVTGASSRLMTGASNRLMTGASSRFMTGASSRLMTAQAVVS